MDKMGSKKNRNKKKDKGNKKQWVNIFLWVMTVLISLIIAWLVSRWMMDLTFTQTRYIKPGELSVTNGLPLLIVYLACLAGLTISGYFMGKKMEE